MVWYSHLSRSLPQFVMIHTVKGFSVVDETEVDIFMELPCFLYDLENVSNLISGSSACFKPSLAIWKSLVFITLRLSVQDFKHDLASMGDECNYPMASTFSGTTLLGNWYYPSQELVLPFLGIGLP